MTLTETSIAVIGAGNLGESLIRGLLLRNAAKPDQIIATGPREERRTYLQERYGIGVEGDNEAAVKNANIVVLAVKPQILFRVGSELAPSLSNDAIVVSVAAGVGFRALSDCLGHRPMGRAMPNIPALVGAGMTAICANDQCGKEGLAAIREIFSSVGEVIEVEESLLDAVTGLSGSGPAFVFMMIEALADAGVKVGLPRHQAQTLAAQTVAGSARLLIESGEHPGILKDRVTSPGGTAIAGLHTLEEGGLRPTLINAVVVATQRAQELGKKGEDR